MFDNETMSAVSRKRLEQLYIREGKSVRSIATQLGMGERAVSSRLKELGIEVRRGHWTKSVGGRKPLTAELLHKLRYEELLTREQIAEKYGYTFGEVRVAIRNLGVKRSDYHATRINRLGAGELWYLHVEQRQSMIALGRRFGVATENVRRRFDEVGIPVITRLAKHEELPRRPKNIPTPDLALLKEVENEAAERIRIPRQNVADLISEKELRRLHHDEKLPVNEIAAMYRTASAQISRRMHELGIEIRNRRTTRGAILRDGDLERLEEIYERQDVAKVMRRHGIARRDDPSFSFVVDLDEALVRDLYANCELPFSTIGLLCGRAAVTVSSAVRQFGIELRPARIPRKQSGRKGRRVTAKRLEALVAEGLSLTAMAKACGYASVTTLRIVADTLQVSLPDAPRQQVPTAVLRIVGKSGVTTEHAQRVLDPRHLGKGSYADLSTWPWPPSPVLLRYLFNELGLSKSEIMQRLRMTHEAIDAAFGQAGIATERLERARPFGRWEFDADELRRFVRADMSNKQIAEQLGVSEPVINRWMHRCHLPVLRYNSERRVRFDDLVSDARVVTALRRAKVPLAGIDPPNRGPLPSALVVTLIEECGLSAFDVELLTGRVQSGVRRDLRASGSSPQA